MAQEKRLKLQDAILRIRSAIRDIPEMNRLLDFKEEFTPEEIISAIESGIDFINYTGYPFLSLTKECMDRQIWNILKDAVIAELMDMMIIYKARNWLTVNDGGGVVNREGNLDIYRAIKIEHERRAEQKLAEYKDYQNKWA